MGAPSCPVPETALNWCCGWLLAALCHRARSCKPRVGFSYFGDLGRSATFKAKKQPVQAAWDGTWGRRAHSPRGRAPSAVCVRQLSRAPRAPRVPRPRCAPTPPAGSPSHLAMIGRNRPCLVPTGQRSCPFLGRARPSRQRIPARPRGHQPPPPRPAPSLTLRAASGKDAAYLAPLGTEGAQKGHQLVVPQSRCFSPQTPGHWGMELDQSVSPDHPPSMRHWELRWRGRGTQDRHSTHRDPRVGLLPADPGQGSCGKGALNNTSLYL